MPGLSTVESDTDRHANCMRPSRTKKKSSALWLNASSGSRLYLFFICSRWRASSLSNPKEPTPTPNSSQCPDQGYCTIHRWPFFIYSKKFRLLLTLPPSCPFLRTLQYQRDWRKKESKKRIIYTSILIQGCSTRFVAGEERVLYDAACAC